MLAGLLIVTGLVELADFANNLRLLTDTTALAPLAQTLQMSATAAYQHVFFLALFTGVLGGTCLWLGFRIQKRALATPHTIEETRTALAYTTVALLGYAIYYASLTAFVANGDAYLFTSAVYAILAALIFHWAR